MDSRHMHPLLTTRVDLNLVLPALRLLQPELALGQRRGVVGMAITLQRLPKKPQGRSRLVHLSTTEPKHLHLQNHVKTPIQPAKIHFQKKPTGLGPLAVNLRPLLSTNFLFNLLLNLYPFP